MLGNKSVVMMRLKYGGPQLQVNDIKLPKYPDLKEPDVFCETRCITYCVGKRSLSFNITEKSKGDCVYSVIIDVKEESGDGSSAYTSLQFIRYDRYGILSNMGSKLCGSYELFKQNYCVPTLPETELTCYFCAETGYGSYFTLEKKRFNQCEVVERVKSRHAFIVGDDETISVKVKVTNDKKSGLRVEVDRPVKMTVDYSNHVFEKIEEKMEREIQKNVHSFLRNATVQLPPNGPNSDSDPPDHHPGRIWVFDEMAHYVPPAKIEHFPAEKLVYVPSAKKN